MMDEAFEEMWNDAMGIDMSEPKQHKHDYYLTEGYSQALGYVETWLECGCGHTMSIDEYVRQQEEEVMV